MKKAFATEVALARPVVEWLRADGWTVYQEVSALGSAADIVAVKGRLVWVLEAKTSFGLPVICQAEGWTKYAHWTSVVVPWNKEGRFALKVCRMLGVGVVTAHQGYRDADVSVRIELDARFNRRAHVGKVLACLLPEQQTFSEAGNASSKRWTPFKETCRALYWEVRARPGCTMTEALGRLRTHYKSPSAARSSLTELLRRKVIPGIELREEGRKLTLHPVDSPRSADFYGLKSHAPEDRVLKDLAEER